MPFWRGEVGGGSELDAGDDEGDEAVLAGEDGCGSCGVISLLE